MLAALSTPQEVPAVHTSVPNSCRKMSRPLLAHSFARVLLLVVARPISRGTTYVRTALRRASVAAAVVESTPGCVRGSLPAGRVLLVAPAAFVAPPAAAAAAAAATCSEANLQHTVETDGRL